MRLRGWLLAAVTAAGASVPALSQPAPAFDLSALLECRVEVSDYLNFRRWISRGGPAIATAGFAWRSTDLFQASYALAKPAAVFGMQARSIGLTSDGLLAEVAGTTPAQLTARLQMETSLSSGQIFLATKLVAANDAAKAHAGHAQVAPTDLDALFGEKPRQPSYDARETIRVVTNQGRPGKTFVGCNYVSAAESPNLPFPQK